MFYINELLKEYYPNNTKNKLGIVHIFTSNPVFLVFNKNEYPDYIVRKLDVKQATYLMDLCHDLYGYLQGHIAKPLKVIEYKHAGYFIEEGVAGDPWFQIKTKLHLQEDWKKLIQLCILSIDNVHIKVAKNPKWCSIINLGNELKLCHQNVMLDNSETIQKLNKAVIKYGEQLNELGDIEVNCQHGDYAINNVMVNRKEITIIDLEDFGKISFPLFDEISFAISIYLQIPANIKISLWELIEDCCELKASRLGYNNLMINGAVLYTLLFRLGPWSEPLKRQDFKLKLIAILNEFLVRDNES